jgi:2-polyprenyl-6-methoxyphenol hydroxylase-like FAD-dependent oxidoreductase
MTVANRYRCYDAIIVGARPAGAATAMLLARAGLRVLVVDKARRAADTISTHALMRAGVLQLTRWGLLDRVIAAGTPPVRQATFYVGSDRKTIPVRAADGVDALYAPRRTILDPIIADAAEASGAELRYGVTVKKLQRDSTGRVIGISGHDHLGWPVSARAPLTVGADGGRRHSDQRRPGLRLRGHRPRPVPARPDAAASGRIPAASHRRRTRTGRTADRRHAHWPAAPLRRTSRPPATCRRTGLGAGRRRRLLQGPDYPARHHRRAPRRAIAGLRHH